jgi:hypothetical protein
MEMPTALSWRTTSDRMCGHEVIRILTLGPVTCFMVGDKVQANVDGEFVNGIVTRQRKGDSLYRIQLEDGDRSSC